MVQAWNSNAWAIQAEKSEVQGHSQLHSKFEGALQPHLPSGSWAQAFGGKPFQDHTSKSKAPGISP